MLPVVTFGYLINGLDSETLLYFLEVMIQTSTVIQHPDSLYIRRTTQTLSVVFIFTCPI